MSPRPLPFCVLLAFLVVAGSSWASISVVADLDSNATNGPDTLAVDVGDTVLVRVWITDSTDSLVGLGITLGDTSGALAWVEEEAESVYTTPAGWMTVPVQVDDDDRLLLQAHDFSFSQPLRIPRQVAELKFVAVSPESCVVFSWNPEVSGWLDWEFAEGTFENLEGGVVCLEGEQDGAGGVDSGGDDVADGGEDSPGGGDEEAPGLPDSSDVVLEYFDGLGNPVDYGLQILSGDFVPGEILVWFKPGTASMPEGRVEDAVDAGDMSLSSDVAEVCRELSVSSFRRIFPEFREEDLLSVADSAGVRRKKFDLRNAYKLAVPSNASIPVTIEALAEAPSIMWAEPNYLLRPATVPNDPRLEDQWPNHPTGGDYIGVEEGWDRTTGAEALRLGFVDTGVYWEHTDLGSGIGPWYHIKDGFDYYDSDSDPTDETSNSHGTKVAGVAAALTNNELGIAGVVGGWMPDSMGVSVYAFKASDSTGVAPVSVVAHAIESAAAPNGYGCRVIASGLVTGSASVTLEIACANAHIDMAVRSGPRNLDSLLRWILLG